MDETIEKETPDKPANLLDETADRLGSDIRAAVETLGNLGVFLWRGLSQPWSYRRIVEQMFSLGIQSLGLIIFISTFVGFISPLAMYSLTQGMFLSYLGTAVLRAVLVDMGPTFTGLILAGRMGTRIASELGSMRVTEQLDAMTCLNLDPYKYVVCPRLVASFLIGPMMFVMSSIVAIVSAQVLATFALGLPAFKFYSSMKILFDDKIIYIGLYKSIVFTGLIGLAGCYFGFNVTGGASGVGKASRATVTGASVLLLIANFFLTAILT